MANTSIEWTEITWNPTTGCTKISEGCKNCYAEAMSKRLKAMGHEKYSEGFKFKTHSDSLVEPYNWKKPKVVFVNSMSDLFHQNMPLPFLKAIFDVMIDTPQHTYQVLTKRAEKLKHYAEHLNWSDNIWLGVSVESQKEIKRIDFLREIPAKIKFLSIEPLIAPITDLDLTSIDWVIVGGESGPKARPINKEWVDYIHNQCKVYNVPFFFKQWGKPQFNHDSGDPTISKDHPMHAKGGCQLDGNIYKEMPVEANM